MNATLVRTCGLLLQKNLSLSTAESCTGGLLGAAFTEIAGSSEYYIGGIISYDNTIKQHVLNVPQMVLEKYGAVSKQTVEAMALGVQNICKTDCALSTSGIAGPGGATAEKPIGLVCIGIVFGKNVESQEYYFSGDRQSIRAQTVDTAVRLLMEMIIAH